MNSVLAVGGKSLSKKAKKENLINLRVVEDIRLQKQMLVLRRAEVMYQKFVYSVIYTK